MKWLVVAAVCASCSARAEPVCRSSSECAGVALAHFGELASSLCRRQAADSGREADAHEDHGQNLPWYYEELRRVSAGEPQPQPPKTREHFFFHSYYADLRDKSLEEARAEQAKIDTQRRAEADTISEIVIRQVAQRWRLR